MALGERSCDRLDVTDALDDSDSLGELLSLAVGPCDLEALSLPDPEAVGEALLLGVAT